MTRSELLSLKPGDKISILRFMGYHEAHGLKQGQVYTFSGLSVGDALIISDCNVCKRKCSARWGFIEDWSVETLPITEEEASRALPLPSHDDVARFFGIER